MVIGISLLISAVLVGLMVGLMQWRIHCENKAYRERLKELDQP
jgi:hypothetical protein